MRVDIRPVVVWERTSGRPPRISASRDPAGGGVAPPDGEDEGAPPAASGVEEILLGDATGRGTRDGVRVAWQPAEGRLVAATDPLAVRPLYWMEEGGRLAIGTSALDVAARAGGRLDPAPAAAAAHLLGHAPPADASFFTGARRLPPGHRLVADRAGLAVVPDAAAAPPPGTRPLGELLAEIERRLLELAGGYDGRRVGVALSGGLDSAVVATARAIAGDGDTVAVTWTAPGLPAVDEEAAARRLAQRLGLPIHAVRCDDRWPLSGGETALAGRDRPLQIALPEVWDALVAAAAAADVEVLLTGAGGDHLFRSGSFFVLVEAFFSGRWRTFARETAALRRSDPRRWAGRLLRAFAVALAPRPRPWRRPPSWVRRELAAAVPRSPQPLFWWPQPVRRLRRESLDPASLAAPLDDISARAEAFGVEVAHPLLDPQVVALALEVAGHDLVDRGREKWPLRRLLGGWLPDAPVGEHSGRSVSPLVHRGLRERGRDVAWSLLTLMQAAERGWVDEERLRAAYRRYLAGGVDLSFWRAMTLEAWLRRCCGAVR